MKAVKQLQPLSIWLMRLAAALFILLAYFDTFAALKLSSITFYISTVFMIFGILLFIGGFLKNSTLTVISSAVLILATGYHAFLNLQSAFDYNFGVYVILGSLFVYFLAHGNSGK
ncbi:MAG: hypothetical protein R6U04_05745 [Bacteroidales bacterium]